MGALDIGIDLGTTKIIIYKDGEGELLNQPAVVAVNTKDDTLIAVGDEALKMLGKTPSYIKAEFPLANGVISDYVMTELMLKDYLEKACKNMLMKYRVIICVPSVITDVEKRVVVDTVKNTGGRKVYLIDEPIAAALGAGIDIMKPSGQMVVDIGGGTADVAVISLGGVVTTKSIRYAGEAINNDIIKLILSKYKLLIGERMAETVKKDVANLFEPDYNKTIEVRGRNMLTSFPQKIEVSEQDIYDAVAIFGEKIVAAIKNVLESTPPELVGDIYRNGITLTGGGALLRGLPELIKQEINVEVHVADEPIKCVSKGTGKAFEYIETLQTGFSNESVYN